jgi:hypothetical protein
MSNDFLVFTNAHNNTKIYIKKEAIGSVSEVDFYPFAAPRRRNRASLQEQPIAEATELRKRTQIQAGGYFVVKESMAQFWKMYNAKSKKKAKKS